MRRAIPYPCNGPNACKVFSTIKASVPCQTSALWPIVFSCSSYGLPIPICYSPYGNAIEETSDPGILFRVFSNLSNSLGRPYEGNRKHCLHIVEYLPLLDSSETSH